MHRHDLDDVGIEFLQAAVDFGEVRRRVLEIVEADNAFRGTIAGDRSRGVLFEIHIFGSRYDRRTERHQPLLLRPPPQSFVARPPAGDDDRRWPVAQQPPQVR
jgi:hypothetical protein